MEAGRIMLSVERVGDGTTVVAAEGEVDLATAPELEAALLDHVGAGNRVVLDLTSCEFIDSSGLRTIVRAHGAASEAGGVLALVVPHTALTRVFELAGLHRILDLHRTRSEAVSS